MCLTYFFDSDNLIIVGAVVGVLIGIILLFIVTLIIGIFCRTKKKGEDIA